MPMAFSMNLVVFVVFFWHASCSADESGGITEHCLAGEEVCAGRGKSMLQISSAYTAMQPQKRGPGNFDSLELIHWGKMQCQSFANASAVPLNSTGFASIQSQCCLPLMIDFIFLLITNDGSEVCNSGALNGMASNYDCPGDPSFTQLLTEIGPGSLAQSGSCAWIRSSQALTCPTMQPSCPNFPSPGPSPGPGSGSPSTAPGPAAPPAPGTGPQPVAPPAPSPTTSAPCSTATCPANLQDETFFGKVASCSLVTKGDATVAAHNVYTCMAVDGTLYDGSPSQYGSVDGIAYVDQVGQPSKWNFNNGFQAFADSQINFAQLETFVHHPNLKNFTDGDYTVIVASRSGTMSLDDVGGGQAYNHGKTLVIFNTADSITITSSSLGRQFGPSIFAPLSDVTLLGEAGFIDGCVIAKTFQTSGPLADTLQLHGDCYKGPLCAPVI